MSTENARLVILAVAGVAFFAWLLGVLYLRRTLLQERQAGAADLADPDLAGLLPKDWAFGTAEVSGPASRLLDRATGLLVREGQSIFGPVKVLRKTATEVAFASAGAQASQHRQARPFRQGLFRFHPLGPDRTRVDYAVQLGPLRTFLRVAVALQVLGLLVLVGGGWAMLTYVATAPEPAVRGQAFQTVQVVHLIWPPYLCVGLYRRCRHEILARFDAFAHNLPYVDDLG